MTDEPQQEQAGPARFLRVTVEVLEEVTFYAPAVIGVAIDELPLEPGTAIGDARLQEAAKAALGAALASAPKSVQAAAGAAAGVGEAKA